MNGLIMALARSPLRRLVGRHTAVLCYTAPKSGRPVELPVEAVADGDGWLVAFGHSEHRAGGKRSGIRCRPHSSPAIAPAPSPASY